MTGAKWYSPQLSRDLVRRLYFKAKAEGIPMTVLANRLLAEALSETESVRALVAERSKPGEPRE